MIPTTIGPRPGDSTCDPTAAAAPPAVVLTLVHGTVLFARWPRILRFLQAVHRCFVRTPTPPAWFEDGSAFVSRLTSAFADRRVHLLRFSWSGANTVWDRVCAAGADGDYIKAARPRANPRPTLRDHIAEVARAHPGVAHVLIAHSHGANVALYALRDDATRAAVQGLVCLSTPFMHVRQRADSSSLATMLKLLAGVVYFALFMAASYWVSAHVPSPWDDVFFVSGISLVLLAFTVFWTIRQSRREALNAWARSIAEPGPGTVPTLVVLSDGDEALLALKVTEGLNVLARGLWSLAYWLPERMDHAIQRWGNGRLIIYAVLALTALGLLLATDAQSPLGPNPEAAWSAIFIIKVIAVAALLPVILVFLLALALATPALVAMLVGYPALVFSRWLAFGWGGSVGVDITAETCPLGTATVTRLAPSPETPGLRHAHCYNDPRAVPEIAAFVMRTVEADG
jgi:hypothetical protein